MIKTPDLIVDNDNCFEIWNIGKKVYAPLKGFMDSADYKSVVNNMHLDNGQPWTLPVTLPIPEDKVDSFIKSDKAILKDISGQEVAEIFIEDIYKVDYKNDLKKIFGVDEVKHPGVAKEVSRSPYRVGGQIKVLRYVEDNLSQYNLSPKETKQIFAEKGWKKIVGFQTRNPIHKAHEYLQKIAMEIVDGIFIHPLIGWKKADDFSPYAVIKSYEIMVDKIYPKHRTQLGVLRTPMRYAGPREAVFHAILRRNFGCTHFIVGRDHAGVGNYYAKYDAHKLCSQFDGNLGIEILKLHGPYYCQKCKCIVTEKTCLHGEKYALSISGTKMRRLFRKGKGLPEKYMRKQIVDKLLELNRNKKLFCGKEQNEF